MPPILRADDRAPTCGGRRERSPINARLAGLSMMGRVGIEPTTLGLRVRPSVLQRTAGGGISLQTAAPGHAASRDEQQATEPNTYAHSYAHWHARSISPVRTEDLRRRELPNLTLVRPLSGQRSGAARSSALSTRRPAPLLHRLERRSYRPDHFRGRRRPLHSGGASSISSAPAS